MNWQYESHRIFALDDQGNLLAEATFAPGQLPKTMVVDHTYVAQPLRGQGLASQLMTAVAEHFRQQCLQAYATCSYADLWFKRHQQEYSDVIVPAPAGVYTACKLDPR